MLGSAKAFSGFAVKDIAAAKSFYGDTLGLEVGEENGLLFLLIPESQNILIYPKPDHQPAVFTILNFPVEDIDEAVYRVVQARRRVRALRGVRAGRQGHRPGGRGSRRSRGSRIPRATSCRCCNPTSRGAARALPAGECHRVANFSRNRTNDLAGDQKCA